jgi:uncharacterized protein (TIGR04255 family)
MAHWSVTFGPNGAAKQDLMPNRTDGRQMVPNASPLRHKTTASSREMTSTASSLSHLPEYARPPLVEVAASIQFETLRELDAVRLGLLWSRFREQYPHTETHEPLPAVVEAFDRVSARRIGFSAAQSFPTPRLWFVSIDKTRLVQIQPNRLIVNWRKLEGHNQYPRYDTLKSVLRDAIETLSKFCADESLGEITPDQAELTYVNHLNAAREESARAPVGDFMRCWSGEPSGFEPGSPEEAALRLQYVISLGSGARSRLYVELDSAYTGSERVPIYVFKLVSRGAPTQPTIASSLEFLDESHALIVNSFTQLTSDSAHTSWGRSR